MTRSNRRVSIFVVAVFAVLCVLIGDIGVYGQDDNTAPVVPDSRSATPRTPDQLMKLMDKIVTIEGTCQDDTAKPIAGARIRLFGYAEDDQPRKPIAEVKSDADGRFRFSDVRRAATGDEKRPKPDLIVFATAPNYVSASQLVNPPGADAPLSLKLDSHPGTLSGVVRDADGHPIAGVNVFVSGQSFIPEFMSAVSDDQGRYVITDLKRWNTKDTQTFDARTGMGTVINFCYFRLQHPEYALSLGKYSGIPQTVNITLQPPAIAEGQVIDRVTGKPLPNVAVMAQGGARGGWATTQTDQNGHYRLKLNRDYYNIWAESDDRIAIAVKALALKPGQTAEHADIQMVRGGFVIGTVVDGASGQPYTIAVDHPLSVAHYGPARPHTGAAVTSTVVNPDGSYRLRVAPGHNYVYLMDGSASDVIDVEDGKVVRLDLQTGKNVPQSVHDTDPDLLLAARLNKLASDEDAEEENGWSGATPKKIKSLLRKRADTPVGRLLDKLEGQNVGSAQFSESWLGTLKAIVDLGPEAVPELIEELDATNDNMMLRCMGFTLRAIGDKRAMPALIRAIPKTLIPPGSDMGLQAEDPDLLKFAQENNLDRRPRGNSYGFGRPVREIFGALRKLTGQKFNEEELYNIFLDGTASQKRMKQELFYRTAKQWSDWWELNSADLVSDVAFRKVGLAKLSVEQPPAIAQRYKVGGGTSGAVLESVFASKAREVFYDLDTGRTAPLPKKWRESKDIESQTDEIVAWAAKEGFDLMGTEYTAPDGQRHYALRAIGMQAWELPPNRWKMRPSDITIENLKAEGTPIDGLLLHHDKATGAIDPTATAPIFYITHEGTPGVLFVGVEVKDNSLKPGGFSSGDEEFKPVAFQKGRRFGYSEFEESK